MCAKSALIKNVPSWRLLSSPAEKRIISSVRKNTKATLIVEVYFKASRFFKQHRGATNAKPTVIHSSRAVALDPKYLC